MKQGEEKRNASLRGRAVRQKRRKEGGGAMVGGSGEARRGKARRAWGRERMGPGQRQEQRVTTEAGMTHRCSSC